jgi:hypothetical protein
MGMKVVTSFNSPSLRKHEPRGRFDSDLRQGPTITRLNCTAKCQAKGASLKGSIATTQEVSTGLIHWGSTYELNPEILSLLFLPSPYATLRQRRRPEAAALWRSSTALASGPATGLRARVPRSGTP